MERFEHVNATKLEAVFDRMEQGWQTRIIAGGTDLLQEMKNGIISPNRLINIKELSDLRGVHTENGIVSIGALTSLDEVEKDVTLGQLFPSLVQAAGEAASPQLRNMATIGGNICQRPRCWYYRNAETPCLRKGGKECYAVMGENMYHAVFGGGPCHIVCPSDLAPVLVALDARVVIQNGSGSREVPVEDFFVGPRVNPNRENILAPDELITAILLPQPLPNTKSFFKKVRERGVWDFALASVCLVAGFEGNTVRNVRLVLGGVAPNPWRSLKAEEGLLGQVPSKEHAEKAADLAIAEAKPMRDNGYKIDMVRGLVQEAIESLN